MRQVAAVCQKAGQAARGDSPHNSLPENELCEPVRAVAVRNETTPMWIGTTDRRIRNPMLSAENQLENEGFSETTAWLPINPQSLPIDDASLLYILSEWPHLPEFLRKSLALTVASFRQNSQ
ncbi:hypothetical protein Plim_1215 [Planctopirus limnophila DSM 3776]|uniref:Uncharacterized protein n=1 Tax=Planctopirus limnophila (strain ATCC 43296 / DSM 3776 / IFAM 1008 / Mu 290) TaxID=521674 RepID=D5SUJ8_PLAL2|nr:hypothetical protein Plim_1215 [Planctopirus limnophila DSM 3776]